MKIFQLKTGILFTDNYSKGQLETLSIGDYGKSHNVKANFLGYTRELNGVVHKDPLPLSEKWVITLSTQYGCSQKCVFCDCPKVPFKGNVSHDDLWKQFYSAIRLHPNTKYTERLNIHFARMGEPIYNPSVLDFAAKLYDSKYVIRGECGLSIETLHPVLTTSLPTNFKRLSRTLKEWIDIKNHIYNGQAGLQLSINTTNEAVRQFTFNNNTLPLEDLSKMAKEWPIPKGRKYCLNFAYATGAEIDGAKLASLFSPDKFMCKITPIHNNTACKDNKIETVNGYSSYLPYKEAEDSLLKAGFDVLVFVPSIVEETSWITCGNAILSQDTHETTI